MSISKIPLRYEGPQGEKVIYTLFDSGATFSCIHPDMLEGLELPVKLFKPLEVAAAARGHYFKTESRIAVDFYYADIRLSDEFLVVPDLSEDAILGVNTLRKWRIKLDFEHDTIYVDPKAAKAMLK